MAIFNAWCDRIPMLMLGGVGPMDAFARRPWVDWIHTSSDMAALVRDYTKWDDQPASVAASLESILRAYRMATTAPQGPVYVCLDAGLQEEALAAPRPLPPLERYPAPRGRSPAQAVAEIAAALARGAPADPHRPRGERSRVLRAPRTTRRASRRTRDHRSQDCGELSDAAPSASIPGGHLRQRRSRRAGSRGGRHPQPGLGRSCGLVAPGVPRTIAGRDGHTVFAGLYLHRG
jgi:hypothetical protein